VLSFLEKIWHAVLDVPFLILGLLVEAINGVIAAIAALAKFLLGLLPSFPDPPGEPDGGLLAWLLWMVPLGTMLSLFSILVAMWIGFLAIKTALNWVKVL
jgi:hypothetical protein